jgi:hypothetical protein
MTVSANVVADSISEEGARITTFELEYPRFIHAEFLTHRLLSRNAQSSRAVPVPSALEQIRKNTARPSHWGAHQSGMQAKEECNATIYDQATGWDLSREEAWDAAMELACDAAEAFFNAGYHKQIVNRLTEPFAHIKVVCTATEYDNFFWLRRHPDAQPEIQELAERMWQAREASTPRLLAAGQWHVPYYGEGWVDGTDGIEVKNALMVSSSCAAQVSYRRLDDSLEKAEKIFRMLVDSKPVHASPFEHQATPITYPEQNGVTHTDRLGNRWSANFRGWVQHRQLIPQNTCWDYQGE